MEYNPNKVAQRRATLLGALIRLDYTSDQYTNLRPGDTGVVDYIDDYGTIFAKWSNGSSLGLVPESGDRFTVIS